MRDIFLNYCIGEETEEWENDDDIEQIERWEANEQEDQIRESQEREEQRKVLNMLVRDGLSDELFCKLLEKKKEELRKFIIAREKGEITQLNSSLFFEERDNRVIVILKKSEVKTAKGKKYRVIGFDLFSGTVVVIVDTNGLAEGLHGYTEEMYDVQEMSIIIAPFVLGKSDKIINVFRICGEMKIIGKTTMSDLRNTYRLDYSWKIMSSFDLVEEFCKERKENSIAVLVNVKMGKIQKYHNRYQMKLNRLYVNLQDGMEREIEEAYFHGVALLWLNNGMASILSLYGIEGSKEIVLKERERIQNSLFQRQMRDKEIEDLWAGEESLNKKWYENYEEERKQEEALERHELYYYDPFKLADERYRKTAEKRYVLEQGVLYEQYPDEYDVFCNGVDVWGMPVSLVKKYEMYGIYDNSGIFDGETYKRFFLRRKYSFPILNRIDRVEHIMNLICKINTNFVRGRIPLDSLEPNDSTNREYGHLYRNYHIGTEATYYNSLYDKDGYGLDGYHLSGRDKLGYDREGYNQGGYDREGFNREGYDFWGFNRNGINQYGFDRNGRLKNGEEYDEAGYNAKGFNQEGVHRNGTRYDARGYDVNGLDENGSREYGGGSAYGYDGYNKFGYDRKGYNRDGYDRHGRKKV